MQFISRTAALTEPVAALTFPATPSSKSFALQYTAVIMIVLTFIVGSFVRPHLPVVDKFPESVVVNPAIGRIELNEVFAPASAALNQGALDALITFTKNHDVTLNIEVYADPTAASSETELPLALARSVTVVRNLIEAGINPEFLIVTTNAEQAPYQLLVEVQFSTLEAGHESK